MAVNHFRNLLLGVAASLICVAATSTPAAAKGHGFRPVAKRSHIVNKFLRGPSSYRATVMSRPGGDLVRDKLGYLAAHKLTSASMRTLKRGLTSPMATRAKRQVIQQAMARKRFPDLARATDTIATGGTSSPRSLGNVVVNYRHSLTRSKARPALGALQQALFSRSKSRRQAALTLVGGLRQLDRTLQNDLVGFRRRDLGNRYAYGKQMAQDMAKLFNLARASQNGLNGGRR